MKNGAFAPMEQMLDFPYYFQIHSILFQRCQKAQSWSKGLNMFPVFKVTSMSGDSADKDFGPISITIQKMN